MFVCEQCSKNFKTLSSLNHHIKTAKSCGELRHMEYTCEFCMSKFTTNFSYKRHINNCVISARKTETDKLITKLQVENQIYKIRLEEKDELINKLLDIAKQPRTVNKTKINKINNYNNLQPLDLEQLKTLDITVEKILERENGLTDVLYDTLSKSIVCTDVSRLTFNVKTSDGYLARDPKLNNTVPKIFSYIKDPCNLTVKKFTEENIDNLVDNTISTITTLNDILIEIMQCTKNKSCKLKNDFVKKLALKLIVNDAEQLEVVCPL